MASSGPVRVFTHREMQVADGIRRELSYAEIAGEITRLTGEPMSPHTVRSHVRAMAYALDEPRELPPRWRIFMWTKTLEWTDQWAKQNAQNPQNILKLPTPTLIGR